MKKHQILFIPFIFLMAVSCNQGVNKDEVSALKADTAWVTVLTFEKQADTLANKPVRIEGTVSHTCKHGGKRLFLVDGTDSVRVKVTTGDNIAKFDESLEGSRVQVIGLLKEERIDNKYLNEWEAELKNPKGSHDAGIHSGAKGHEDEDVKEKLDQINTLRTDLKNSGKDHLSFYSIEAISFTLIK